MSELKQYKNRIFKISITGIVIFLQIRNILLIIYNKYNYMFKAFVYRI